MTNASAQSTVEPRSTVQVVEYRASLVPRVEEVLGRHGLMDAYRYVRDENPSNELPYHNLHHAHCLVINCAEGAEELDLPRERWRVLLLAAVFHDFGHSGGKVKDHQNIEVAIDGLQAFARTNPMFDAELSATIQVIESTEFPPVNEPMSPSEEIIRDADLMQMYMPDWPEQVLDGLRREIEVATGTPISLAEMVRLQVKFMEGTRWRTSWATRRAADAWPRLIEEVMRFDEKR